MKISLRLTKGWLRILALVVGMHSLTVSVIAVEAEDVLTNEDIIRMAKADYSTDWILRRIKKSETDFDVTSVALRKLLMNNVDYEVLFAMRDAARAEPHSRPEESVFKKDGSTGSREVLGNTSATTVPESSPGTVFRDQLRSGGHGPQMVVLPPGHFRMGCLSEDDDCFFAEAKVHVVHIAHPIAISVYEVTFEDYDRFAFPIEIEVDDRGWGRGHRPVINVSWNDAQKYVAWLSNQTGAKYRLPSEAEWEYAARAGSQTKYSWGDEIGDNRAVCDGCGSSWDDHQTAPVGSFSPNSFGLHDMHGNVWEWVDDCWNDSYIGAPSDGSAWEQGKCWFRVLRGGSWNLYPWSLRAAFRLRHKRRSRDDFVGFRVVRRLNLAPPPRDQSLLPRAYR